jgi:hypothetical protein
MSEKANKHTAVGLWIRWVMANSIAETVGLVHSQTGR